MPKFAFPALDEVAGKKDHKEKLLKSIFDQAMPGGDGTLDLTKVTNDLPSGVKAGNVRDIAALIKQTNDELTDLGKEYEDLMATAGLADQQKAGRRPGAGESGDGQAAGWDGAALDIGALFAKSAAFTQLNGRKTGDLSTLDIELKTLMTTAAGWSSDTVRTGRVVDFATRPLQVAQRIPQTTTNNNSINYMEETTYTNNAAEIAEAGTYPEAALQLTERSSLVRKISVFLPVTDEQLEDESQVRGYLNNRLGFMVRQRLDLQLVVGNGVAPNLTGYINWAGIQTQAKGTDPTPDAVYKAMTKVRVTGQADPSLVIMHPNDWMNIRLLRTADGIYIWGNPSDAGPERIWGLEVAQAQALTQGTGLVMDTTFVEMATRRGLDIQVSNSHGTFFVEGKQAIRADMRVANVVYRPAAICTVTGL